MDKEPLNKDGILRSAALTSRVTGSSGAARKNCPRWRTGPRRPRELVSDRHEAAPAGEWAAIPLCRLRVRPQHLLGEGAQSLGGASGPRYGQDCYTLEPVADTVPPEGGGARKAEQRLRIVEPKLPAFFAYQCCRKAPSASRWGWGDRPTDHA